jgi:O-antigen ligase
MILMLVAIGLAAAIWAAIAIPHSSVLLAAAGLLILSSGFSNDFLSINIGVGSLTLDRLWLIVLLAQAIYDWRVGRLVLRSLRTSDLLLLGFIGWLIYRSLGLPMDGQLEDQPNTSMHLINGYLLPLVIYLSVRCSRLDERQLWPLVSLLLVYGLYLGLTALAEVAQQWWLVFPKTISDPKLGIHFGRARGPMLQSVRLGMVLVACLALAWTVLVWSRPVQKLSWLAAAVLTPLCLAGAFLTYTRSIWMAIAALVLILAWGMLEGPLRRACMATLLVFGLIGGIVAGPQLVDFKRGESATETRESSYLRKAFNYVSWQMIKDRPLSGFGFNQFQLYSRYYVDDRTTELRLEAIRGYVHHNTYTGILVDLGLIGGLLAALAAALQLSDLRHLALARGLPRWAYGLVLWSLCIAACHAIQMLFHDVTFSTTEHGLLALSFGLCQAAYCQFLRHTEAGAWTWPTATAVPWAAARWREAADRPGKMAQS